LPIANNVIKITDMAVKKDDISSILKQVRKQTGLSRLELSELAGVGKTLIFDIESGRHSVSYSNLQKICRVLNIKIQFLPPIPLEDKK
jgi:transcriptional regulator with XRE-family HTH domain